MPALGAVADREFVVQKGMSWNDDFEPSVDIEERTVEAFISTYEVDRDGEIVLPGAYDKNIGVYKSNPILIASHLHKTMPIGKCISLGFRENGIWGKYKLATTQAGEEALTLFAEGCLRGFSPGFIPLKFVENPTLDILPPGALRTANGKRVKKAYVQVELVEVSALAIPSNRRALVEHAEKGNEIAQIIRKGFEVEDKGDEEAEARLILKEWTQDKHRSQGFMAFLNTPAEPIEEKGIVFQKATEYVPTVYEKLMRGGSASVGVDSERSSRELIEELHSKQNQMMQDLNEVKNKDSWLNWGKKWGLRLALGTGAYLFFKKTRAGQTLKQEAKDRLKNWIHNRTRPVSFDIPFTVREANVDKISDDEKEVKKLTDSLDVLAVYVSIGKRLGLQGMKELEDAEKDYNELTSEVVNLVLHDSPARKEFRELLGEIVTKAHTEETFEEEEHPRNPDGTFKKKVGGEKGSASKSKPKAKPKAAKKPKKADVIPIKQKPQKLEVYDKAEWNGGSSDRIKQVLNEANKRGMLTDAGKEALANDAGTDNSLTSEMFTDEGNALVKSQYSRLSGKPAPKKQESLPALKEESQPATVETENEPVTTTVSQEAPSININIDLDDDDHSDVVDYANDVGGYYDDVVYASDADAYYEPVYIDSGGMEIDSEGLEEDAENPSIAKRALKAAALIGAAYVGYRIYKAGGLDDATRALREKRLFVDPPPDGGSILSKPIKNSVTGEAFGGIPTEKQLRKSIDNYNLDADQKAVAFNIIKKAKTDADTGSAANKIRGFVNSAKKDAIESSGVKREWVTTSTPLNKIKEAELPGGATADDFERAAAYQDSLFEGLTVQADRISDRKVALQDDVELLRTRMDDLLSKEKVDTDELQDVASRFFKNSKEIQDLAINESQLRVMASNASLDRAIIDSTQWKQQFTQEIQRASGKSFPEARKLVKRFLTGSPKESDIAAREISKTLGPTRTKRIQNSYETLRNQASKVNKERDKVLDSIKDLEKTIQQYKGTSFFDDNAASILLNRQKGLLKSYNFQINKLKRELGKAAPEKTPGSGLAKSLEEGTQKAGKRAAQGASKIATKVDESARKTHQKFKGEKTRKEILSDIGDRRAKESTEKALTSLSEKQKSVEDQIDGVLKARRKAILEGTPANQDEINKVGKEFLDESRRITESREKAYLDRVAQLPDDIRGKIGAPKTALKDYKTSAVQNESDVLQGFHLNDFSRLNTYHREQKKLIKSALDRGDISPNQADDLIRDLDTAVVDMNESLRDITRKQGNLLKSQERGQLVEGSSEKALFENTQDFFKKAKGYFARNIEEQRLTRESFSDKLAGAGPKQLEESARKLRKGAKKLRRDIKRSNKKVSEYDDKIANKRSQLRKKFFPKETERLRSIDNELQTTESAFRENSRKMRNIEDSMLPKGGSERSGTGGLSDRDSLLERMKSQNPQLHDEYVAYENAGKELGRKQEQLVSEKDEILGRVDEALDRKIDEVDSEDVTELLNLMNNRNKELVKFERHQKELGDISQKRIAIADELDKAKGDEFTSNIGTDFDPDIPKAPNLTGFITKEMSEEEFEEHEHPRNPDGTFKKKVGGSATSTSQPKPQTSEPSSQPKAPPQPKGQHGGARKGAGRPSQITSVAVEDKLSKYRIENPGMPEAQVRNKVYEDAKRLNKSDWIAYLDNPAKVRENEIQRAKDAARSRRNVAFVNGQKISAPLDAEDVNITHQNIRGSQSAFAQEVAKQRTMRNAIRVFRNKNIDKVERDKAKLVLALGGTAMLLGVASLMLKRPALSKAGLRRMSKQEIKNLKHWADSSGKVRVSKLDAEGNPIMFDAVENFTTVQLAKVTKTGKGDAFTVNNLEVGGAQKWFGTGIKRLLGEVKDGEEYALVWGGKVQGLGKGSRFNVKKRYGIDLSEGDNLKFYTPAKGDISWRGGIKIVDDKTGKVNWDRLLTEKFRGKDFEISEGAKAADKAAGIPSGTYNISFKVEAPGKGGKIIETPVLLKKTSKFGTKSGETETFYVRNPRVSDDQFNVWLADNGLIDGMGGEPTRKAKDLFFPKRIVRNAPETPETLGDDATLAAAGNIPDWMDDAIGPVSRKAFALLSMTTGIGATGYYFSKDVEAFSNAKREERDRRKKPLIRKPPPKAKYVRSQDPEVIRAEARSKERAARAKELEAETKLANAQQRQAEPSPPSSSESELERLKREAQDLRNRGVSISKGYNDLVIKAPNEDQIPEYPDEGMHMDDITDAMAEEVADQIILISDSCRIMIENGVPGHTGYEELNEQLYNMYMSMKDLNEAPDENSDSKSEDEVEEKGVFGPDPEEEKEEQKPLEPSFEDKAKKGKLGAAATKYAGKLASEKAREGLTKFIELTKRVPKGFEGFIEYKEMSDEEFDEPEHPRAKDGKFTDGPDRNKGSGQRKAGPLSEASAVVAKAPMMSGNDRSAGLFVPEEIAKLQKICPRCHRQISEEVLRTCKDPECPISFRDNIEGEYEAENLKEKSDGLPE